MLYLTVGTWKGAQTHPRRCGNLHQKFKIWRQNSATSTKLKRFCRKKKKNERKIIQSVKRSQIHAGLDYLKFQSERFIQKTKFSLIIRKVLLSAISHFRLWKEGKEKKKGGGEIF